MIAGYRDHIATGIQIVQLLYNGQGEPADYLFLDMNAAYVEFSSFTREILGKKATELHPHRSPVGSPNMGRLSKQGKQTGLRCSAKPLAAGLM